jgi:hypothetical protein
MRMKILLAAVAAVALFGGSAASARIVVATFTGTVLSGHDMTGLFGLSGINVAGQTYLATYVYNTNIGEYLYSDYGDHIDESSFGVAGSSIDSPLIASLTINGHTESTIGNAYALVSNYIRAEAVFGLKQRISYTVQDCINCNNDQNNWTYIESHANNIPVESIRDLVPLTNFYNSLQGANGVDQGGGSARFRRINSDTKAVELDTVFEFSSGTFEVTGEVPEPSTWGLMIGGFGLAGAALRRRRAATPA